MPSAGVEHDAVVRRALVQTVWLNKAKYEEAEGAYQRHLAKLRSGNVKQDKPSETRVDALSTSSKPSVVVEAPTKTAAVKPSKAAKAGKNQSQSCPKPKKDNCQLAEKGDLKLEHGAGDSLTALQQKLNAVESDNHRLSSVIEKLNKSLVALEKRVEILEKGKTGQTKPAEIKPPTITVEDEDDVDLFGSDEDDDEEREKLHDQRVKAYEEKKSKKTAIIAKSNIILDVKPWDDETDMKKMEESVRAIVLDGLVWGAAKLVPLAYGIFKLQISCVVEDDKVSVDDLQEKIEGLEELVQSVDIAAFNKV